MVRFPTDYLTVGKKLKRNLVMSRRKGRRKEKAYEGTKSFMK